MVIRMRHNRSQTKQRRSHHGLTAPTLSACTHCGAQHRPHHMCQECGYYNGRQVMDLAAQKAKRDARIKAKEERIKAEAAAYAPETEETVEEVSMEDNSKEAREENDQTKRPEQKPE